MALVYGYEYKPAGHLLASDEDAADFLQSQFSNELHPFEPGRCTYGLWLDVKGKVVADSSVLCVGEAQFRILSEHSLTETIADKLERHIIADDVVVERLPEGCALALIGDEAAAVLQSLSIEAPTAGRFINADGMHVYRGRRSFKPCFELWSESAEKISELRKCLVQEGGVQFISMQQVELMRLAAGFPSIPKEIGPSDLPGEGALVNNGVSLTKGCYLGQEVVARMHNVGRAQRALFLMCGSGEAPKCPVGVYNHVARQVGELRSAFSTEDGWQGVALLKIRHATIGESLSYESGSANVVDLFSKDESVGE